MFKVSETWTVPQIVLRLTAGPLALTNVSFQITDNDLDLISIVKNVTPEKASYLVIVRLYRLREGKASNEPTEH